MGATKMSCINRTASAVRPVGVATRRSSDRICITMAVDDKRQRQPDHQRGRARQADEASRRRRWRPRCPPLARPPAPNTARRSAQRRWKDNSKPQQEEQEEHAQLGEGLRRRLGSEMVTHSKIGKRSASPPKQKGPSARPARRKPSTALTRTELERRHDDAGGDQKDRSIL
jgi:hypothetical protein